MDEIERLRRLLDEPDSTSPDEQKTLAALRQAYEKPLRRRSTNSRLVVSTAIVVLVTFVAVLTLRSGPALAWSPTPVLPHDPALLGAVEDECLRGAAESAVPHLIDQREDVAVALLGTAPGSNNGGFSTCTLIYSAGSWDRAVSSDLDFVLALTAGTVDEAVLEEPISRVVIETHTQDVEVSYRDGFYLIWWPADLALDGEVMRFLSGDGSELLAIPVTHEPGTESAPSGNT